MLQKLRANNQKGFTLIELMIVIAIIGILAAIAVPQFLAYRIRSYNSSAKAVAHNIKADEGNLNSELGEYGQTEAAATTLAAPTGAAANSNSHSTGDTALRIAATATANGARLAGTHSISGRDMSVPLAIGDNMNAFAVQSATNPDSFVVMTRHHNGDTAYGMDSDVENVIYSVSNPNWAGAAAGGQLYTPVPSTISADDFTGAAGNGAPTANWMPSN
jgi:type IV pilus assembly protein PilA